jgi:branched-chain amino acid transport system substrate-binding protein
MIAALEKADLPSVRGKFKYNTNHFPIENFYLLRIVKDPDGGYVRKTEKTVFADHADAYVGECKMQH